MNQGSRQEVTTITSLYKIVELHEGIPFTLTLLHSENPKLNGVVALLSAKGLKIDFIILYSLSRFSNRKLVFILNDERQRADGWMVWRV